MGLPPLAAGLLLTTSASWGQELEEVSGAIVETLQQADTAVGQAAEDLGRTGLTGSEAHARLQALCDELTYAVTCSAIDDDGILVSEAPGAFTGVEGRSVRDQEHVRELLRSREPVLSELFHSVEGFDALTLAHPVFGPDGELLGSVSVMARPASLIGHAVKPVLTEGGPGVFVLQLDGTALYDPDDDLAKLRQLGRRLVAEREGTGEYRLVGRGLTPPVHERASWTTVGLHDTEWRVGVTRSVEGGEAPVVRYDEPAIPIPAEIGLTSLVTLTEGHLTGIADDLGLIAARPDVRSGDWARIEEPLRRVSEVNVPALFFFALPDGSYWSVERGRAQANLSDRAYFQEVLEGQPVVGELVLGKTKGEREAVVAIPLKTEDGEVIGVLGASVYLDELSARIADEMGLTEGTWFYAFDEDQRLALYPDPQRLFLRAGELGPEVEPWFTEMQDRGEGVMRYTYEGLPRTLLFRRSPVTGWTYAFGFVGEREEGA